MAYSELDIRNFVKSVSNSSAGFDFICYLLDEFGVFTTRINLGASDTYNICNHIKREQGEFILDLIREHNFEKFVEIQRKRSEKCQKTMN